MLNTIRRSRRGLVVAAILGLLISGTYVYTFANVVPTTKAGEGNAAISGFTISQVDYIDDDTESGDGSGDPTILDHVTWTASAPVTNSGVYHAYIRVVNNTGTWYPCTQASATTYTCDTSSDNPAIDTLDDLDVVLAD